MKTVVLNTRLLYLALLPLLMSVFAATPLRAQFLDEERGSQAKRSFIAITSARWADDDRSTFTNFQIAIEGGGALDEERHWYFMTSAATGQLDDSRLAYTGIGVTWFPISRPDRGVFVGLDGGFAQAGEFFSGDVNAPRGSGGGLQFKFGVTYDPIEGWPPLVVSGVLGLYDVHRTYKLAGLQVGLMF